MSDLTTLATLERVIERARDRLLSDARWSASGILVLELLVEEIKAERAAKPPHVTHDDG
jgi:hypothetical protein